MKLATLLLCAAGLLSCSRGESFVLVTVTSAAPLTVSSLEVRATNNGQSATVTIRRGVSFMLPQSFVLDIDPARRGDLLVEVTALGATGSLASAGNLVTLKPGGTAELTIALTSTVSDGGGDLARPDAAPSDDLAGPPGLAGFDVQTAMTAVSEHESFFVHLIARDAANGILTTYTGSPALTTDWGDLRVIATPQFSAGEADAAVSLNRETNPTNGPAHVIVSDGVSGRSADLVVTEPAWTALSGYAYTPGAFTSWEASLFYPVWIRLNGGYVLWYAGYDNTGIHAIGQATSSDGIHWTRYAGNPVMLKGAAAWENVGVNPISVLYDAGTYVMLYTGFNSTESHFGIATSADGITWARGAGNPLGSDFPVPCDLPKSPWAVMSLDAPGHYRIVYQGSNLNQCSVTSSDGAVTWPASSVKMVTGLPMQSLSFLSLAKDGSVYRLWLAFSTQLYATSTDQLSWVAETATSVNANVGSVVWNEALGRYESVAAMGNGAGFVFVSRP